MLRSINESYGHRRIQSIMRKEGHVGVTKKRLTASHIHKVHPACTQLIAKSALFIQKTSQAIYRYKWQQKRLKTERVSVIHYVV